MTTRGDDRNDWLESRACRDNTFWFFGNIWPEDNEAEVDPGEYDRVAHNHAKRICQSCPVLLDCRRDAKVREYLLPLEDRFGVCAGMTPMQRWKNDGSPS